MKDNDLIRRGDVFKALTRSGLPYNADAEYELEHIPAVDAVGRGAYEQVAWERDVAIAQLSDIGKGLCAKMDDVAKVVRCLECNMADDDRNSGKTYFWCLYHSGFVTKNDFCSHGQRKKDGDA